MFRASVLIGFLLLGAGCATTQAPVAAPPKAVDYAPLKIGATWTYRMNFPGQSGDRRIVIVGQKDGYFFDNAGGQFRHAKDGLRDPKRYMIREPVQVGLTWKAIVSASAVERYEIVSVGEACRSLAGTFSDCLIVKASLRQDAKHTLHIRFAWARNIGLVKVTTELETGGKRIKQTSQSLMHYNLRGTEADKKPAAPQEWSR